MAESLAGMTIYLQIDRSRIALIHAQARSNNDKESVYVRGLLPHVQARHSTRGVSSATIKIKTGMERGKLVPEMQYD